MSRRKTQPEIYTYKNKYNFDITLNKASLDEEVDVVYCLMKTKVSPQIEQKDYTEESVSLKNDMGKLFEMLIKKAKDVGYIEKSISDFRITEKSLKYKKKSFAYYDLFVKTINKHNMDYHINALKSIIDTMNDSFVEKLDKCNFCYNC